MPRFATGSVRWRNGRAYARVTLGPKDRPEILLTTCKSGDEDKARERARILAEIARQLREADLVRLARQLLERAATSDGKALESVLVAVERLCTGKVQPPEADVLTFRDVGEMWTSGELARRWPDHVRTKKTAHRDRDLLRTRVYPIMGDLPITVVRLEHAEEVMASLPAGLAPASRRQHAQAIARVLSLAAYPLRAIERSPIPRGFVPAPRSNKALSYLYPDEDRALLRCAAVPLGCRMLYGVLAREGMREGEARSLTWSDLDLERGAVRLDENKTDDPRAWSLDPGVTRALVAWRAILGGPAGDALVFGDIDFDWNHAAAALREHLKLAGVKRPELFARSAVRLPIRVHDLRGTFVTLALANGRTETWVADRTGHRSSVMINRYRRTARTAAELGLGELAPLIDAVPELTAAPAPGPGPGPGGPGSREKGQETGKASVDGEGDSGQRLETIDQSRAGGMAYAGDLKSPRHVLTGAEPSENQGNPAHVATPREAPPDSSPFHGGVSRSPRGAIIADLSALMVRALEAGDVAAARVAHESIGRLLGSADAGGAEVIDITKGRRGGQSEGGSPV